VVEHESYAVMSQVVFGCCFVQRQVYSSHQSAFKGASHAPGEVFVFDRTKTEEKAAEDKKMSPSRRVIISSVDHGLNPVIFG
jgi:hypothetical protein